MDIENRDHGPGLVKDKTLVQSTVSTRVSFVTHRLPLLHGWPLLPPSLVLSTRSNFSPGTNKVLSPTKDLGGPRPVVVQRVQKTTSTPTQFLPQSQSPPVWTVSSRTQDMWVPTIKGSDLILILRSDRRRFSLLYGVQRDVSGEIHILNPKKKRKHQYTDID